MPTQPVESSVVLDMKQQKNQEYKAYFSMNTSYSGMDIASNPTESSNYACYQCKKKQ